MKPATKIPLISLLCLSAYSNYVSSLVASNIPKTMQRFSFFHNFKPGDLVMEISTIYARGCDSNRIGILVSDQVEPLHTEEEWKILEVERKLDGFETDERPTGRIFRIKLLLDGSEFRWHNASMIRVPLEMKDFPGLLD